MQTIVFKLSYKSANAPSAKILNIKHLHYIATRPGTVRNKGCGFGLFGKLPHMSEQRDINNLWNAQKIAREASNGHTLWRAVLSLDHETALAKGFYPRKAWENLIAENISCVAKGMGIEQNDICYMASMHYKKGHPHSHLIFWDKSRKIHTEYMKPPIFVTMTENIRAEFNKSIFKEEITQKLNEQKEISTAARAEMLATVKELNAEEILDVNRIKNDFADSVNAELKDTLKTLSSDKNRRYAYLNPESKAALNSLADSIFSYPQFSTLKKRYIKATNEVSKLYGNSKNIKVENLEKSMAQLYKDVGNTMLKFIKENDLIKKYVLEHPPHEAELIMQITNYIGEHIKANTLYSKLASAFPCERTPLREFMDDEFKSTMHSLVLSVLNNSKINGEIYLHKSFEKYSIDDADFASDKKSLIYGQAYRVARQCIMNKLYDESGYMQSYKADVVERMLITLFSSLGQSKNQQLSRIEYKKHYADLSETAMKDLRAKRKQAENGYELY